ncbi:MAG: class I SAM-dependent methyltransferase [Opitutales bacterium]
MAPTLQSATPNRVPCPVCGHLANATSTSYSVEASAQQFVPQEREPDRYAQLLAHLKTLWPDGHAVIFRCPSCDFGFAHPHVGGDARFYELINFGGIYPRWRVDYDSALENLPEQPLRRALDLGAGHGSFLRTLPDAVDKHATESNPANVATLRGKGIDAHLDLTSLHARFAGQFDLITAFQTLEHLADFRTILKTCAELLAPKGRVILTMPHVDACFRQEERSGEPDMPPCHCNRWSENALKHVFAEIGMQPVCFQRFRMNPLKQLVAQANQVVRARSYHSGTLANQVVAIPNRKMRRLCLAALLPGAALRLAPYWRELSLGGSFLAVAEKPSI